MKSIKIVKRAITLNLSVTMVILNYVRKNFKKQCLKIFADFQNFHTDFFILNYFKKIYIFTTCLRRN